MGKIYEQCKIAPMCRDDIAAMFDIKYDAIGNYLAELIAENYLRVIRISELRQKKHYEVINLNNDFIAKEYLEKDMRFKSNRSERQITVIGNRTIVRGFGRQDPIKHKPKGAYYTGWNTFSIV